MIGLKELPRGDQMWMTRVIESKSAVSNWLCLTQCRTAVVNIIMCHLVVVTALVGTAAVIAGIIVAVETVVVVAVVTAAVVVAAVLAV